MKAMNQKIGVGVLWNLASLLMTRGASTIFLLFLARMLAPEAFGLVAMATVIFELANAFVNSGLGAALIRSKEVSSADLNTVFYTNLGLSLAAYTAIFIGAPYIADFYGQPDLTVLVRVMGLVVFMNAAKVVQVSVLSRNMNFRTQMKANTFAAVISGFMAVVSAYQGWGVWSLVIQMLSQAFVSAAILWIAGEWRPGWQFSVTSFWRLFGFGRNLLAEGLLSVIYQNSYVLVIGRLFSAELTGLYFFAKKISSLISNQLTSAVQQATFPALSTLQDDNEVLKKKYRQIMQLMMFLIAPIMMLLAALASPLVAIAFNEKWQGAVTYLQLLCIVGMIFPLHALNMNLLNVKGRSDLVFKAGLAKKAVNLTMLILAIPYGVLGIVVSQVAATFLALIPNTYFSKKLVGYSLRKQVSDVIKPIVSAVIAAMVAWCVAQTSFSWPILTLLSAGLVGFLVYLFASFLIRAEGALFIWFKAKEMIVKGPFKKSQL